MATEANATIPALPVKPSKEDEIRFIRAITESIPAGSYLSSLLAGVGDYCEQQIRDDMGIGLLDYREMSLHQADQIGKLTAEIGTITAGKEKLAAAYAHDLEVFDECTRANNKEIAQLRAAREEDQKWIAHLLALQEVLQLEAHKRALAEDLTRTEKGIALARETLAANPQPTIPAEA